MRRKALLAAVPSVALAILVAPFAGAQTASLASLDKEMTELVKKLAPAIVRVGEANTGVCISPKGLVLTDLSVARAAKDAQVAVLDVYFADKKTAKATVFLTDESTSTAILRLDSKRQWPSVRPGNPADLAVGHMLLTIGNSFGSAEDSTPAVTLGVLSSIQRDAAGLATRLETSAATNPGQEGGPYFNIHGDLIGLELSLPAGDDLATVTPIDRLVSRYATLKPAETIFDKPRVLTPPATLSEAMSQGFAIAAKRARKGIVTLVVTRADPAAELPPAYGLATRKGPVSGTLLDAGGIVVAALPPFLKEAGEVKEIAAYAADGRKRNAVLLARDHKAGFAILQLETPPADSGAAPLTPLPQFDSSGLDLGQFCITAGAPIGPPVAPDAFVTTGILSSKHQIDAYRDALQTDAGINPKNAGGALVDLRGRLIGVILPPAMPFGSNSGLGFAMPIDVVMTYLPRWRNGGEIEPAMIGAILSDAVATNGAQAGIRVDALTKGLPAEAAGVAVGDVVTHLDGTRVLDRQAFTDFLMKKKCAGDALKLTIARGKEVLSVSVVLARRS